MHFFLFFFQWKMSIQDDSLRNLMLTSALDNDIIPSVCPDEVNSADGKRKQKICETEIVNTF